MENQPTLNSIKDVTAFLAERFPPCFSAEGEARPLKIGIFQDLVKCMHEENLSKTQLRTALRLYTSSWRYLYSVKFNAQRIDLDGNACGELEQHHVDYARLQLEEAKARVQAQRARRNAKKRVATGSKPYIPGPAGKNPIARHKGITGSRELQATPTGSPSISSSIERGKPTTRYTPVTYLSRLNIGREIKVSAGKSVMVATVLEIEKDSVRVQLSSGLAMIVRAEHLQF